MGKPDKGIEHEAPLMVSIWRELRKHRDCFAGHVKEMLVLLHTDALITQGLCRRKCRAGPRKWVPNDPFPQWQNRTDHLA